MQSSVTAPVWKDGTTVALSIEGRVDKDAGIVHFSRQPNVNIHEEPPKVNDSLF